MTKLMKFVGRPYEGLLEGDIVELVRVEPSYTDPASNSGFTWPEYTVVKTEDGIEVAGHSHRFEPIDEPNT